MILFRVAFCFVGLYVAHGLRELVIPLHSRGRGRRGLQLRSTKDDKNKDGEFKISAKVPVTVEGGLGEGSRQRRPAPLSDSAVVLVGTCACLAACVVAFLFINRDILPPPY